MSLGRRATRRPTLSGWWRSGVASVMLATLCAVGCAGGTIDDGEGTNDGQGTTNQQPTNQQPTNQQPDNQQPDNQGGQDVGNGDDTGPSDNQGPSDNCQGVSCDIGEVCNPADGSCVGCLSNDNCSSGRQCDTERQICGDCLESEHCSDGLFCEPSAMECVGCRDNGDCIDGQFCELSTRTCDLIGECAVDEDCGETAGVCDPDEWSCVECVVEGDCADDLICDEQGQTCLECLTDQECDGGAGECLQEYAVCAAPCCDFETSVSTTISGFQHRGFDITVDGQGRAVVGFADRSEDLIGVAIYDGGTWNQEIVEASTSVVSSVSLDVAVDSHNQPHLVVGNGTNLFYFWRDQDGWNSEVLKALDAGNIYDVALDIDADDRAHMIVMDIPSINDISYFWRDPDGTSGDELVDLDHGNTTFWVDLAVGANQQPVVVLQFTSNQEDFWVLERDVSGGWSTSALGESSRGQIRMASDDQGRVWMVSSREEGPVLWSAQGAGWSDELIVADDSTTSRVGVGVDGFGRVHLIYEAPDDEEVNQLYYVRGEGEDWVSYEAGEMTGVIYPKLAVGANGHPHVVGYHSTSGEVRHFSTVP